MHMEGCISAEAQALWAGHMCIQEHCQIRILQTLKDWPFLPAGILESRGRRVDRCGEKGIARMKLKVCQSARRIR